MKKILVPVALGFAAGALVAPRVAAAQTLRYAADPGATHVYERTQQDHVTQTVNGAEQKAEVNSYLHFSATVKSAEEGKRTVEVVHDSVSIQTGPQGAEDYSAIYGKPVTILMDDRGNVTEVEIPDSLPESVARLNLGTTYRGFYPILPEGEIAAGETWADTMEMKTQQSGLDMTIHRVNHYTAKGNAEYAGRRGMQVDYTTDLSIEGSGSQQGADISLSGDGTGTGSFYFLPDPGVYLGSTETSEVKMDAFVVAGEQNLLIPIVQQREETVELKE